jgi:small basic protein (TIGR04137 family)
MSQHPSLLGSQKGKQHRSVIKRYEKLKHLIEKDKWEEQKDSIYRLPKIKSIKFKVKKEKAAEKEPAAEGAAPSAAAAGTGTPQAVQAGAKPVAKPAVEKGAAAKEQKPKK